MKAVILAGGLGTRMREETEFRPKPMVEIGGRPILWHIMKGLSVHGIRDFVIATGYRSTLIKEYFLHYSSYAGDFTVNLGSGDVTFRREQGDPVDWDVTVVYTGELTPTGGRLHAVAPYVQEAPFLVTYGDGLSDVDVQALVGSHRRSQSAATVTAVRPTSRFGELTLDPAGRVISFTEKPRMDEWVNGGFMVMEPEVLRALTPDATLEGDLLASLAREGRLGAYRHDGFWQPMDTYREFLELSARWDSGDAPWKTWH